MKKPDPKILETLSPREREQVVALLARYIIERRKERERLEEIKKLT